VAKTPEIALLISTYQRPRHLQRALVSIAMQQGVEGKMEVVVTDDGSTDETAELVKKFASTVDFPVQFTTHEHSIFQLSRCRNEGTQASTAPYMLILDGDCLLPPDHVAIHLARRQPGVTRTGQFVRLDEATSNRINEQTIRSGEFIRWAPTVEIRKLRNKGRRSIVYEWLRHPAKPRLVGNNIGIWRSDYERINGFDENFQGWGFEDDDLGRRLRRAGVRLRSILAWTTTFHMWHPTEASMPQDGQTCKNELYLNRPGSLWRCRNGLVKRPASDLRWRIVGEPHAVIPAWVRSQSTLTAASDSAPEVEVLVTPGQGQFSGRADCNILVALEQAPNFEQLARQAHMIISDRPANGGDARQIIPLRQFENVLKAVA
jgi:glycosyltransferase involved in cell wall biosynthesis